ncbi:uncharacterized protein LOC110032174 [Phalaenopsis equestris]|uniref:uncharacterized protein LOC110032174 n=1 Tax=Phalaenopsis equestris TaxID=78828 RepID=UPI0009E38023|nr:uncharacterized protein LOC110032174 [Phalaenopsis equestris]
MGYEKKLAGSFRQAEPRKLTYGLLLVCFIVLLTYLSISQPYDALLSSISLKLSSTDTVQESDLKSTEEFSNAESKTGCSNDSSRSEYLCQSNVMQRNSSSADVRVDLPHPIVEDEVKEIYNIACNTAITSTESKLKANEGNITELDGTIKEEQIISPEKWKSMCDYSNRRSNVCELAGDVRIPINQWSVLLVVDSQFNGSHKIRPYARKSDLTAMSNVAEITLKLSQTHQSPLCTHRHHSPALMFSLGGYSGNYFHAFTDIFIPLFQTSYTFHGKVHLVVSDAYAPWINKFLPIFQRLSDYDILSFSKADNGSVHCFPKAIVGLQSYNDMKLKDKESTDQFIEFLRRTYSLERSGPLNTEELSVKKPRLLVIARRHTRRFVNVKDIVRIGKKQGFEVVVGEAEGNVTRFARVVNTCDVMMGVHGAALTNFVFLPTNAVLIQVVPWGKLDWITKTYFKEPAINMRLRYLEYQIEKEESTLMETYGKDDPVIREPESVHKLGWERMKEIYLEKQNVRLNVTRFKWVLVEAMRLLREEKGVQ